MYSRKKHHGVAWFVGALLLVMTACGPASRVEPLVGDRPDMVDRITGSWKEAPRLSGIRGLAASFVRAWRDGEHEAAWVLLSPAWRKRFAAAAGEADALELFKKGRLPGPDGVTPWDPVLTIFGERLMYLSLPTEEMGIKDRPGRVLVYAVQDDGTWTSFIVVSAGEIRYLEPIGLLK